jgi:hypothetical protein
MKLRTYLNDNNLTQHDFIEVCKEKTGHTFTQGCISKWVLEKRRPRADECKVIYDSTNGKVSPNDFYL